MDVADMGHAASLRQPHARFLDRCGRSKTKRLNFSRLGCSRPKYRTDQAERRNRSAVLRLSSSSLYP